VKKALSDKKQAFLPKGMAKLPQKKPFLPLSFKFEPYFAGRGRKETNSDPFKSQIDNPRPIRVRFGPYAREPKVLGAFKLHDPVVEKFAMVNVEEISWAELHKELSSQEDISFLEIKDRQLPDPDTPGAFFLGTTVFRPVLFSGVTFPACRQLNGTLTFTHVTFKEPVTFHDCSFQCTHLAFDGCCFEKGFTFIDCQDMPINMILYSPKVRGQVRIDTCRFDSLCILPGTNRQPVSFEKLVDIEGCSFNQLQVFGTNSSVGWNICDSVFEKSLAFSNSHLDWLLLKKVDVRPSPARIPGQAPDGFNIRSCILKDRLTLEEVQCDGDFSLVDTAIGGWLRMTDTSLNGKVDFFYVDKGSRGECGIENVSARLPGVLEPLYRYAKVAKTSRGDLDAAGRFYYLERKAHNAAARVNPRWPTRWAAWVGHILGDWLMGYGEKPFRPLCWAAGTILVFALLFWALGAVGPQTSAPLDHLYFSVVTFTTLGYGDLYPNPGFPRALAATEAVLGFLFMSLFLVVLTRRFIR
jgi:hypothetical protein